MADDIGVGFVLAMLFGAAGLSQFHSNKSFEYLLDVLDSNEPVVDEHDTAAEAFIGKQSRFCSLLASL